MPRVVFAAIKKLLEVLINSPDRAAWPEAMGEDAIGSLSAKFGVSSPT